MSFGATNMPVIIFTWNAKSKPISQFQVNPGRTSTGRPSERPASDGRPENNGDFNRPENNGDFNRPDNGFGSPTFGVDRPNFGTNRPPSSSNRPNNFDGLSSDIPWTPQNTNSIDEERPNQQGLANTGRTLRAVEVLVVSVVMWTSLMNLVT